MINYDSANYWFSFIKDEPNVPKTIFVPYNRQEISLLFDGGHPKEYDRLYYAIETILQNGSITPPAFIRTDITSAKHAGIAAIKITPDGDLNIPILKTLEHAELKAIHGPLLYSSAIMLREWLDLDSKFTAFHGLPIANEWRVFVGQRGFECMHPYWPEHVLEGYTDSDNWKSELKLMQQFGPSVDYLAQALDIVRRIGHGSWSFDFAKGKNDKWYLTDMATAEHSYHADH